MLYTYSVCCTANNGLIILGRVGHVGKVVITVMLLLLQPVILILIALSIYRVRINYRRILQNHIFTNTEEKYMMLLPCLKFHSDHKCIGCAPHV